MPPSDRGPLPHSRLALSGLALAALAAATALLAGLGARWGWWGIARGFAILTWSAYAGIAAALLSLLGAFEARPGTGRRGLGWAALGAALGLAVVALPWSWRRAAEAPPAARDISTDPEDPPGFVAVVPLRPGGPEETDPLSPAAGPVEPVALPELGPAYIGLPPDQAFDQALAVARRMGWRLVDAEEAEGRIEAVASTRWFGVQDDIVIRLRPEGDSTRVDVRAVTRTRDADGVATSAMRIRQYLQALENATARS